MADAIQWKGDAYQFILSCIIWWIAVFMLLSIILKSRFHIGLCQVQTVKFIKSRITPVHHERRIDKFMKSRITPVHYERRLDTIQIAESRHFLRKCLYKPRKVSCIFVCIKGIFFFSFYYKMWNINYINKIKSTWK